MHPYIEAMNNEVVPALGCTEPIAIAFAVAKATQVLGGTPEKIELHLSANMIKNAMSVGIPGTTMVGIDIAAALGAIVGNGDKELEVLQGITDEDVKKADALVAKKAVTLALAEVPEKLYIKVVVAKGNDKVEVIIKDLHTNIVEIIHNGKTVFEKEHGSGEEEATNAPMTVDSIYEFITTCPLEDLKLTKEAIRLNKTVSEEGLTNDYGLQVGKTWMNDPYNPAAKEDIFRRAAARAAAGSDARMNGATCPVMTVAGSGNMGITSTMPVVSIAESLGASEEKMIRAVALSHLITIHIKSFVGRLSPLCGCVIAAPVGAGCGMVYLMDGSLDQIKFVIQNMLGNVSGTICDGAKAGCALKIGTSVLAAAQSVLLAMRNIEVSKTNGIVDGDVEETIKNLGELGNVGMKDTDRDILDIMIKKSNK